MGLELETKEMDLESSKKALDKLLVTKINNGNIYKIPKFR